MNNRGYYPAQTGYPPVPVSMPPMAPPQEKLQAQVPPATYQMPVQNSRKERHKSILQDMTVEQKAHIYDVLVEQLVKEGSYSILACGYITSKVITSVIDLKAEGKL